MDKLEAEVRNSIAHACNATLVAARKMVPFCDGIEFDVLVSWDDALIR